MTDRSSRQGSWDHDGPAWLRQCFLFTILCGVVVSCIPDSETPAPSASPADLKGMELSAGPLQPTFVPANAKYDVLAPNSTTTTTVTASTADANARLMINNQPATSGQAFGPITLDSGPTPIVVLVEPPGTVPPKSYTVVVTHGGNANLASLIVTPGTLAPPFSATTLPYTVDIVNSTLSVTVRATVQEPTSSMTINGTVVASGAPFVVGGLQVGANPITIRVRAVGGAVQDYVVTVNRAATPSTDASLSSAQVSAVVAGTTRALVLCPSFSPTVTSYSVTPVPNGTTAVSVVANTASLLATLRVNGQQVTSGQSVSVLLPNAGNHKFEIAVTAQAGNSRTYTFTIERASVPSGNSSLGALTLSAGSLSPAFCHNTTAYSVTTSQASTTVTAIVADPAAILRINGAITPSGQPSMPILLGQGRNVIPVTVTAQNGSVTSYTLIITRS